MELITGPSTCDEEEKSGDDAEMKIVKRIIRSVGTRQAKRIKLEAKRQETGLPHKIWVEKVAYWMERMGNRMSCRLEAKAKGEQQKIALEEKRCGFNLLRKRLVNPPPP